MIRDTMLPDKVKRRQFLLGAGTAGAAALAGCTGGSNDTNNSGQDGTGGTGGGSSGALTLAQVKEPIEFDPIVLNDVPSAQISDRIFTGLYTYDETINVVEEMAAGEPEMSKDGTRYVVELQEGVTFQNGEPVTATDVKYSFEAPVKEETANAAELNMVDAVSAVDERTVQFDLKFPYGPFMNTLTWSVVPKEVREKDKEKFNKQNPVGAGPFVFDTWKQGNFVRIKRWEDYWGEPKPNLASVEFTPIPEPTTRITSLKTGESNVIEEIPPQLWEQVEAMGNASIESVPGVGYFYLAFNCKQGPTADPTVREAVDYCFDMDQAVANFVEPTGVRQYSPLPKQLIEEWGFPVDEWKKIPHGKNIDKAKQLLDGSDAVPDNWTAKILVPPDEKRKRLGVTVANGLKEAGYGASVQQLEWGTFLQKYKTGDPNDYNMYTLGWSGTPDPDAFTYYFFTEDAHGVTDGTYYNKVNEQIVNARKSADREERKRLYTEAITTLLEDRAHLAAYNLKNSFGVSAKVKNFAAHPVSSFALATPYANTSL